ncbi:MAG: isoprenylcysteine carboxylmethyltransferase family protein [Nitrospirae bacterium]|jgi:protein-S-isoprenylcysteine O-methyltransferase Ste14|nr:isoprenylcysteine carboxylmethyltransferase family protein [Nitrospirota bacterium]
MKEFLAIATLMFWPVIPIFWIPLHFSIRLFRRLGIFTYIVPGIAWFPVAYLIWTHRHFLLKIAINFPLYVNIAGLILLISGTILHIWTIKLLGFGTIIGLPEVFPEIKNKIINKGPFSVVRHPTYLAHTLMFSGVFLFTGFLSVGLVALLDFFAVNLIIIPLEEKEMLERFGNVYKEYCKKVSSRFIPWLFHP